MFVSVLIRFVVGKNMLTFMSILSLINQLRGITELFRRVLWKSVAGEYCSCSIPMNWWLWSWVMKITTGMHSRKPQSIKTVINHLTIRFGGSGKYCTKCLWKIKRNFCCSWLAVIEYPSKEWRLLRWDIWQTCLIFF